MYAPPAGIGNYGGEVDNWRWPRHSGDVSFYRAYVGKDGQPADYDAYPSAHHRIAEILGDDEFGCAVRQRANAWLFLIL